MLGRALSLLSKAQQEQHFYTGLMYCNPDSVPFDQELGLVDEPLSRLSEAQLRPNSEAFAEIMESFK